MARSPQLAPGTFSLEFESSTGRCAHCYGLPTLKVVTSEGVIGYVVSEWPWSQDIPEAPADHPTTPHYLVEWYGTDRDGNPLGITDDTPFFIATAIHERHQKSQRA